MSQIFTATNVEKNFFIDSVPSTNRGKCFSLKDYGIRNRSMFVKDAKVHDANFAFLSTTLSKLHNEVHSPLENVTYINDIPLNYGGGFVDYIEYYTVDWAGIMNEMRNVMGNNANYIPRVNAGLTQNKVNVYSWEVAYDLRFVELEKMKKLVLQKSIQEIYSNVIVGGWDLFCEHVGYLGVKGSTGLFNSSKVKVTTIDNTGTTGKGFEGLEDDVVVSFFNGIFEYYLINSNNNAGLLPDMILVPSFVGSDLSSRFSALYTSTLRKFIREHNLGIDESDGNLDIKIYSRSYLNTMGTQSKGRIVAYRKKEPFVRMDIPYPIQHYITLPNIDKMSYTSAFVGQVSDVQMPYNTSAEELGAVTYWDFTK